MIRRAVKWGGAAFALSLPPGAYIIHKYRPHHSTDLDYHENLTVVDRVPSSLPERLLYDYMRFLSIGITSTIVKALCYIIYDIDFVEPEKLHRFSASDRGGTPLVTISNHVSVLDDPGMISIISPIAVTFRPKRMRWTICTEEICFKSAGLASFFGAGKAVPIQRGGSMYQKAMATLQHKINAGDWVNIFSEGRVWQEQGIPLRDEEGRWCSAGGRCGLPYVKVGPIKWGVGKLIANAEKPPIVLPIYHTGFNDAMPQTRENQCATDMPLFNGTTITIKPGEPIPVLDLIDEYHKKASERAIARNKMREAALRSELASRTGSASSWFGWLFGNSKSVSDSGRPTMHNTHRTIDPTKIPINTVEESSDHSGESAHVAGLAQKASPEQALKAESERSAMTAPPVTEVLSTTAKEMSQKARHAVVEFEERARETARDVETKAAETAREIEQQARELVHKLAELRKSTDTKKESDQKPIASSEPPSGVAAKARHLLDKMNKWGSSVSVPAPETVKLPSGDDANVAPVEAGVEGPRRLPASDIGTLGFPLSEAPVVEVVPTRVLRNGTKVPTYVEAPLRIKPPDHDYLTPEEAALEEDIRLQLYSAIATRIHDALVILEREVMDRRRQKRGGVGESRPMETYNLPNGPTEAELAKVEETIVQPHIRNTKLLFKEAWAKSGTIPGNPELK